LINNYPNLPGQEPAQEKLVLPAYSEEQHQPAAYTQRVFVHPDQLRSQMPPQPTNPLSKLGALWRADPAYKVLMVATAMVLVAGIIFTTFLVNTFAQSSTPTPKGAIPTQAVVNAPTSTTSKPPTFPTPSGGQGSKQASSQPPASAPVVLPTLTPSDQPTQPPTTQNLQLQITNIPQQVQNNSDVQVTVMTNEPGASVRLQISFDNSAITNSAGPQQAGGDGNVTLDWHVAAFAFKQNFVARITAIATDQNGQTVQSQTVSVEVSNRFKL